MAFDLELDVEVAEDESWQLETVGEIFRAGDKGRPLVGPVRASPVRSAHFHLEAGRYEYRFHVERSGGEFTLRLIAKRDDDDEDVLKEGEFDTALGFEHRVFKFEVK